MEPAKATIAVMTRVVSTQRRIKSVYISGIGKDATFKDVDLGWWVLFSGSHEALYVGETEPPFKEGDMVKIKLEKVDVYSPANR